MPIPTRQDLPALQAALIADPSLWAHDVSGDGVADTFCNLGAARLCRDFSYDLGKPVPLANDIIDRLFLDSRWKVVDGEGATAHAKAGGLAFAVKKYPKHGHIAPIAPGDMQMSGSFGHKVPMVANVGNGQSKICKVSEAFTVSLGEPRYLALIA